MINTVLNIKGNKKYFISSLGYCFRVENFKEIELEVFYRQRKPFVKINTREYNLKKLMCDYFVSPDLIKEYDRVTFKNVNNRFPLSTIKIEKHAEKNSSDEKLIFKYGCDKKKQTHNYRVDYDVELTSMDVLDCLKRTAFKCFYCGSGLNPKLWQLDHVVPLSQGGKNKPTNITPSCDYCNRMKGIIGMNKFIYQCQKIAENHSYILMLE